MAAFLLDHYSLHYCTFSIPFYFAHLWFALIRGAGNIKRSIRQKEYDEYKN